MFSTFFINRPIFATVLSILIVIAGLVSLRSLPVEQYPTITPPTVVVRASYPGANASTIADMVGTPIEQQVNGVEGMLYMSSTSSSTGSYQLTITFEVGTDLDMATVLVENRVNMALSTLPQEVTQIGVTTTKESTNVVMFLSLTSDSPQYDALFLSNYAALNITNELGRVKGVGNVGLFGMGKYSMRIWLDPDQLTIRGITPADIVSAIQGQNIQVTAGSVGSEPLVRKEAYQYTLETKGLLIDEEEFGNIIVKALPDGKYLRIRDLATIELGRESYSSTATLKGGAVAAIAVYQLPGANALDVAQRVKKEMDKLASYFPEGVQYNVTLDTTEFINASISGIYETLITAFILVLLVILIFLQNWRAMLIPLITIPVSLVGTFTFMAMLGFSINTLTLFGLVLAIGLVVDDAIIIVENSYRLIETGRYSTVKEAVIQAMKEVSGAVVGIVLVLLAVFIPTAFIGGITGQLYKQFALTIAISTVISGFNALTLSPALCALFLKPKQPAKFFLFKAFNQFFEKTNHGYTWVITHFMRKSLMTFIVFLILSVLAFWGFIKWPRTFIPEEDQGYFIAFMQLTDGASSSQTATALQKASAVLNQMEGIETYITINGFSMMSNANASNAATLFVMLKNWDQRKSPQLSAQSLVNQFNGMAYEAIPEARTFAVLPPAIPGLGESSGFEVMLEDINSYGPQELQRMTDELMLAGNETPGLSTVQSMFSASVPQYYLNIDRNKVELMQIPLSEVFNTIGTYLGSTYVNNFVKFGRTYQVKVEGAPDSRALVTDLRLLNVRNSKGDMIPLSAFTTIETRIGAESLTKYNTYVSALISGAAADGYSSGEALNIMAKLIREKVGRSFGYEWTSMAYQEENASSSTSIIFILAIVVAFLILAAQYESWTDPFAVIMGLPIALLGVVIGVMVMNLPISVYTQIGVVLLIALAAKNAILIVEFARDYRAAGKSTEESAIEGGRVRLRPILMTSFAFILGTFPLVISTGAGASSRISLGIAVFAGMLMTSLVGTLFIPNFYLMMESLHERFTHKKKKDKDTEENLPAVYEEQLPMKRE
ncbi:multidrug efflux RND transporter permease subunit [Odoribacter sp. N15.MGS-14]|uniref:efflux RND transporter permease subunit n=1 Tax=Odoribacter sp. N15.MGS-14 TaxID=1637502 RepID=UPI0006234C3F|nr:multidrug efflux RND transporter permease subunit [Odoribacter sp. N15.MGS-14]